MSSILSANNYHYFRGGAESVFLKQNELLEKRGWRVAPFCMKHPRNLPSPWSDYWVDEIEYGHDYTALQKLQMAAKVVYSFEARRKVTRLVDAFRPDVFHAHNIYNHISPSVLGAVQAKGVPVVLTLHDLKIACPAYQMLSADGICERCKGGRLHNVLVHRCVKQSLALSAVVFAESTVHRLVGTYRRNVDVFAVPSRFYIDKLVEWGFPRDRFQFIPNFVDASRHAPDFDPGEDFLYFGRLAPEKGISTLIRAAAAAGVSLTVVGTGPSSEALQELAREVGARVNFTGYMTGDALLDRVRRARAVVLPSEWYENAPMSVLEAYALGKPVLASAVGGLGEMVLPEQTGLLFESGNVDSVAAALARTAGMPDEHVRAWGRAARDWVQTEYSEERYVERLSAVYSRLGVRIPGVARDT